MVRVGVRYAVKIFVPVVCLLLLTSLALAGSQARFPANWKQWDLVRSITIPSAETALPASLSPLFQETIRRYNWVNFGQAVDLDIYINPAVMTQFVAGGPYPDGLTAVGVFRGVNIVFVTEHKNGKAQFGTYDESGRDITNNHSSFSATICSTCHYTYQECSDRSGVCAQLPAVTPQPIPAMR